MWQAINSITTPVTLVAFVCAIAAFAYRSWLKSAQLKIKTASESDRIKMAELVLKQFHINTTGLTKIQQYDIAKKQLNDRIVIATIIAIVVSLIAVLAAIVLIVALLRSNGQSAVSTLPAKDVRLSKETSRLVNDLDKD